MGCSQAGYSLEQTVDGGYVICGYRSDSLLGTKDILLIKTDAEGNTQWERTYGGAFPDIGYCVLQTEDAGYVITGKMTNPFHSGGHSDACVIRTDSLGDVLWERLYGGEARDEGHSIHKAADGGYVVAGLWSIRTGEEDAYLVRIDSLGNLLFERTYGGSPSDEAYSGQQTLDGGYVLAGYTSSSGAGGRDIHLIKTDSLGAMTWDATYGGAGDDVGHSMEQSSDGGYVIVGETSPFGSDDEDVFLVKTDSLGNAMWERTFGGSLPDVGYSVQQAADGGYIIVGKTRSFGLGVYDVYLIKTDENGLIGVGEESSVPEDRISDVKLLQNSPNPFHDITAISYCLPAAAQVTLATYDITGRLVETLVNETQHSGIHQVRWHRRNNPSGVYFYRLEAGESVAARKMVVVD